MKQLYGTVDKVELFVGGLAEDHAAGSSVGRRSSAIIANQFERIRDGDRLWYQNIFSGRDLQAIQNTSLADIIRANTNTTNLQDNVFVFDAAIAGRVFLDTNGNGVLNSGEMQLGGLLVQLVDSSGNIVQYDAHCARTAATVSTTWRSASTRCNWRCRPSCSG